jgi:hypothetical protein
MLVEHNLKFVTEFLEGHPVTEQVKAMPESDLIAMLEGMLKSLVVPALATTLEEINANGSYAILKVAN